MASLRKKPNSKYWYACFKLPDGTRVQRSTKEKDRKEALKIANDYERAAAARVTETQARRVIQEIYERVTGRDLPSQTVAAFLDSWIETKGVELAPSSRETYRAVVEEFKGYLGERQHEELLYVRTADIVGFRDSVARRISANSANKKLKILRTALKAAWEAELIADNPADRVPTIRLKRERFERRAFRLDELKRLYEAAKGEWQGMILFGLYTGQRLGDIARMTWQNVDLEHLELSFSTQKTGRRQLIPLAKPLVDYLMDRPRSEQRDAYLFPECAAIVASKGKTSMLSAQFYEIMVAAGLAEARLNKQASKEGRGARRENNELSFHSLRHTATSILKNAGVSPAVVQEFIGHDSKAISQNYTHIESAAMRRAVEQMPNLLEGPKKAPQAKKARQGKGRGQGRGVRSRGPSRGSKDGVGS